MYSMNISFMYFLKGIAVEKSYLNVILLSFNEESKILHVKYRVKIGFVTSYIARTWNFTERTTSWLGSAWIFESESYFSGDVEAKSNWISFFCWSSSFFESMMVHCPILQMRIVTTHIPMTTSISRNLVHLLSFELSYEIYHYFHIFA